MITFINRFYGIVNLDECIPDNTGWRPKCLEKTWGMVANHLFWLMLEVLWYHAYGIIVAIVVIATIWRNWGREQRAERREMGQDGGHRQSQQLNTNVSIHTNSKQPIAIINQSRPKNDPPRTSKSPLRDEQGTTSTETTTETTSYATEEVRVDGQRNKTVKFSKTRKSMSRDRDASTSSLETETDSDRSERQRRESREESNRKRKEMEYKRRMEMEWENDNDENLREERSSVSRGTSQPRTSVSTEAPPANVPQIDAATLLQNALAQRIQINTQLPINFPPPKKFEKHMDVHEFIRDIDVYIELSNITGRKKTVYWTLLSSEVRELLEAEDLIEDDEIAVEQIREKLQSLFGRTGKGNLDFVREFTYRRQQASENVRLYCTELQRLCKRAFPDMQNTDSYVVSRFIEGILNRELKIQLSVHKPKTVKAMLEIATKYEEAYLEFRNPRTSSTPNNQQHPTNPTTSAPTNDQNQSLPTQRSSSSQPRMGQQDQSRFSLQPQDGTKAYNLRDRSLTRPPDRYNSGNQQPRPCWQFGATDHVIRNCPVRPAARSGQPQSSNQPQQTNLPLANI